MTTESNTAYVSAWVLSPISMGINEYQNTLKWLLYILICHCTSLSPWFIILDKNNFVLYVGKAISQKYFWRPHRDPQKIILSIWQVRVRNRDHEWLRMTNAFTLCNLLWKVQKSHAANREGSFNMLKLVCSTEPDVLYL